MLSGLDVRHHNEGIRWVEVRIVLGEDGIQEGNLGKEGALPYLGLKLDQAHLVPGLHKDVELPGLCPADWVRGIQRDPQRDKVEGLEVEVDSEVVEAKEVHTDPCVGFLPELHLHVVVDQRRYPVLILINVILGQDEAVGKLEIIGELHQGDGGVPKNLLVSHRGHQLPLMTEG